MTAALFATGAKAEDLYGTLKKIKDSGTIVIGHNEDSPPFASFDAKGKPRGYSIDLCNRIVDGIKAELKLDTLAVKYQAVNGQTQRRFSSTAPSTWSAAPLPTLSHASGRSTFSTRCS